MNATTTAARQEWVMKTSMLETLACPAGVIPLPARVLERRLAAA